MLRKSQRTTGPNVDIPATTEFNQGKHAMTQATTETASRHQPAPTSSAVERIGAFAAAAQPEHLMAATRGLFKRNILDSLGCAIAALQGQPFQALRDQFGEYRAPGRCTLIGGGKTSADQAALFNSALVRYVDLLDSYMAPGGLCQRPNHDLHQRPADPGERATRLGGRSHQPHVMGPDRGEIPLAERTFRR